MDTDEALVGVEDILAEVVVVVGVVGIQAEGEEDTVAVVAVGDGEDVGDVGDGGEVAFDKRMNTELYILAYNT